MLDQNTDRMWFVIGAVIVGAAIIFIANGTLPDIFASTANTMNDTLEIVPRFDNMVLDPYLRHMDQFYHLEPGVRGLDPEYRPESIRVEDAEYGRVQKIITHSENQGIFYRNKSDETDVELLTEGSTYRMEVTVRSDTPTTIGVAFDGGRLSRADIYTIGNEWQTIVVEKESNGINTRPRVYTTSAGTFYIAEMNVYLIEDNQ